MNFSTGKTRIVSLFTHQTQNNVSAIILFIQAVINAKNWYIKYA